MERKQVPAPTPATVDSNHTSPHHGGDSTALSDQVRRIVGGTWRNLSNHVVKTVKNVSFNPNITSSPSDASGSAHSLIQQDNLFCVGLSPPTLQQSSFAGSMSSNTNDSGLNAPNVPHANDTSGASTHIYGSNGPTTHAPVGSTHLSGFSLGTIQGLGMQASIGNTSSGNHNTHVPPNVSGRMAWTRC